MSSTFLMRYYAWRSNFNYMDIHNQSVEPLLAKRKAGSKRNKTPPVILTVFWCLKLKNGFPYPNFLTLQ